jgi:hypothetical protein
MRLVVVAMVVSAACGTSPPSPVPDAGLAAGSMCGPTTACDRGLECLNVSFLMMISGGMQACASGGPHCSIRCTTDADCRQIGLRTCNQNCGDTERVCLYY